VSETLAQFQYRLGRALEGAETCPVDPESPGFRFTLSVRRSWCEGRAIMAARTVMTVLPGDERARLVSAYVDAGGGLEWFLAAESKRFLVFLARRLPDPSHALTLCRMAQAMALARAGVGISVPVLHTRGEVTRGPHASLVWFHADPGAVLAALQGAPLPVVGPRHSAVLFAPGLPGLFRVATEAEADLWDRLPQRGTSTLIGKLLTEGVLAYRNDELGCRST
jgi:hypothetical protein